MIENAHIILLAKYTFLFIEPQMWSKNIQNIAVESAIFADCPYLLHLSLVGSDPLLTCRWTSRCSFSTSSNPQNAAKIPKIWRLLKVQDHMSVGTLQFFSKSWKSWWHPPPFQCASCMGLVFALLRASRSSCSARSSSRMSAGSWRKRSLAARRILRCQAGADHGWPPWDMAWPAELVLEKIIYIYIYIYPPTPALAKAGAAPGTTSGVELVFLSNNPKARSMVSSQRGPRQQAPQGHNNGFLGFLWASKPAVCQPLNP